MTDNLLSGDDWVPAACTLPTTDRPLRRAEFDDFLGEDVVSVNQQSPSEVRLDLRADPEIAARAAGLAAKEAICCSFFTFGLTIADGTVSMTVSTKPAHAAVLAGLAARARAKVTARS
jgi:hypothetical protein